MSGSPVRARYRDHRDRPVGRPAEPGPDAPAFYAAIGDFQGRAYRRNAFARATTAEVEALWRRVGLRAGHRVLDVGCGNGRHLRALARRGVAGLGVDVSAGLVRAGREAAGEEGLTGARFVHHDARDLAGVTGRDAFDAAWSLCQGAVGTSPETDPEVLASMVRAVRPGGRVAVTLFHALFAARNLERGDALDPVRLVHHRVSEVRGPDAARRRFPLWTATYTAREACRMARDAGLEVRSVSGCEPGRYDGTAVALDDPELLLIGTVPGVPSGVGDAEGDRP